MNVKKIGTGVAIVGALAVTGMGVGSGTASADEFAPKSPGMTWKLDPPYWNDWDDRRGRGRGWDGPRWDGPRWDNRGYYGRCVWVPPAVSMWVPPAVC